ncbi:hypothetical protein [Capillimicrobium parvum]|uniref:Uncharacterized protein n=1 Tax=Capillimicrobium parvum TaxID=2884022 RepID=A0A9E7C164_9ACTN|nr:hypothetical protein [Capillimicrobium parvum]UGS37155.1 hypothetical protein DSM104329_03570 [Capillimicrobium parvum]
MELRHLTASIVVLATTAGAVAHPSDRVALEVRRGARVTDNDRAAGRSIA